MMKYPETNSTAKAGINYIRTIVESHNSIFQKIDQENDVGIDALIEVVENEKPTGNFFASQIKSGNSYFNRKSNLCKFPIGNHREYWSNYALPVYGIVYIPVLESAYWIDIKKFLKTNPTSTIISFKPTLVNTINRTTFTTQFIPHLTNNVPQLDYEFAKVLFQSLNQDEIYLGLYTLFKKYAYKNEVWEIFVDYFKTHSIDDIPISLIDCLSVIPWHPDIAFYNDSYTQESREYGKTLINKFGKEEVIKLLHFIDEEDMLSRGSLGQSVEAIISSIPNFISFLETIIYDESLEIKLREFAAIIYAYHKGTDSVPVLETLDNKDSWYISELINHLNEFEYFNPYG